MCKLLLDHADLAGIWRLWAPDRLCATADNHQRIALPHVSLAHQELACVNKRLLGIPLVKLQQKGMHAVVERLKNEQTSAERQCE